MSLARSVVHSFVGKYTQLVTGIITTIVLARLLTPEDFGIYSIGASIVLIGHLFRNFGAGQYIIQAPELRDDDLRAAFTVSLSLSWIIGLLILGLAAPVGEWYRNPAVTRVLQILSINFFLLPFGAVADAVLRRQMRFGKLAVIIALSSLSGMSVAIVAAWLGLGYMAIAWSSIASNLVTVLATLWFRPEGIPWLPGLSGLRRIFSFGAKVGGINLLTKGSDTVTELLVGKVHGLHLLGIYSRAYGAYMLFSQVFLEAIRPVVLPYLSHARRSGSSLGPIYVQTARHLSVCALPFFVFLFLQAGPIVRLLYGEQWDEAVPVLRVFCLAGAFVLPTMFFDQFLIAAGRPGLALRYQLVANLCRLMVLIAFVTRGLEAAAFAIVADTSVRGGLAFLIARRLFRLDALAYLRAAVGGALLALVVGSVLALQSVLLPELEPLVGLALSAMLAAILWIGALWVQDHPLAAALKQILQERS